MSYTVKEILVLYWYLAHPNSQVWSRCRNLPKRLDACSRLSRQALPISEDNPRSVLLTNACGDYEIIFGLPSVLQIQFPDDNQENDVLASESLRTGASCPDSYQLRNPSYEIEVEPQSPSHIPRPSQSSGRPRQLSSTSPDTPPIARRLNPGYSGPFSPTLPSDPNSSQRPSHLNPQAPRPDRDDIQCLRDENRELRAENDKLREQHQEEKDRLNDWFKLQEQEIDQKDKEVEHLKKEKEELKKENKELRERKREN
jgi:hypothetical protein